MIIHSCSKKKKPITVFQIAAILIITALMAICFPPRASAASPTITTASATAVGAKTATVGGDVTSDGGSSITVRGVVYSTDPNPTTSALGYLEVSGATGAFTCDLTGLDSDTTYHYRAFATNEEGTAYGADATFTTMILSDTFNGGASVQWQVINDNPSLYSFTANPGNLRIQTTKTDTYLDYNNIVNAFMVPLPAGLDNFRVTAKLSFPIAPSINFQQGGVMLMPNNGGSPDQDNYYRCAYCFADGSTAFGAMVETPGQPNAVNQAASVAAGAPVWVRITRHGTTYTASFSTDGNDFTLSQPITATWDAAYAGIFAINGATGTPTSINVDFDQFEVEVAALSAPNVTTQAATNVGTKTATVGGNAASDGSSPITVRGVVYSTDPNPTTSAAGYVSAAGTTGTFSVNLTGLTPGTTYHFRAFATNGTGTGYGPDTTFTTGTTGYIRVQDGLGYSGMIPTTGPLGANVTMTGYSAWPITKNADAFQTGIFDGESIWMLPRSSGCIVKIKTSDGSMTANSGWPTDTASISSYPFLSGAFDGENLWLPPYCSDRVVRVNKATGTMTGYMDWPSGFSLPGTAHSFCGAVFDGQSIWMIPLNADRLIRIDKDTGNMTGYNSWPDNFAKQDGSFMGGLFDGQNIWLIPNKADRVIKVNKDTGVMTAYTGWPQDYNHATDWQFISGGFDGQNIWLYPDNANMVVKVDKDTGNMTGYNNWSSLELSKVGGFQGGAFDGQSLWMVPTSTNKLVRVNKDSGAMTAYNSWPSGFTAGTNPFIGGVFDGKNVWLIPIDANQVVKVSAATSGTMSAALQTGTLSESGLLQTASMQPVSIRLSVTGDSFAVDVGTDDFTLTNSPSLVVSAVYRRDSSTADLFLNYTNPRVDFDSDITDFSITALSSAMSNGFSYTVAAPTIAAIDATYTLDQPLHQAVNGFGSGTSVAAAKLCAVRPVHSGNIMTTGMISVVRVVQNVGILASDVDNIKLYLDLNDDGVCDANELVTAAGTGGTVGNGGAFTITKDEDGGGKLTAITFSGLNHAPAYFGHDLMLQADVVNLALGDLIQFQQAPSDVTQMREVLTDDNTVRIVAGETVSGPVHKATPYTYAISNTTNKATILGYTGSESEITIPATLGGAPVDIIANAVFKNNTTITSVVIQDGVTIVGTSAFEGCSHLSSVTLPDSVTDIDDGAFAGCTALTGLVLPSGLVHIGTGAFSGCTSLTGIVIPANVTSIEDYAFMGCTQMTSIGVVSGNTAYASDDGVLYNNAKTTLIVCPAGRTSCVIPSGVTTIGTYAFYYCTNLASVTLPADGSVKTLGDCAFYLCSGLTQLTLPAGLTTIGMYALVGCSGLTSLTLPEGITSIGSGAFVQCTGLSAITIPASTLSVGEGAFSRTNLDSITFLSGATGIVDSATDELDHTIPADTMIYGPANSYAAEYAADPDHPRDFTVYVLLQSIEVTDSADKLTYAVGDSLDLNGLEVTGHYADGSAAFLAVTPDDVSGFDSRAQYAGQDETLTITIGGCTTTYTVHITAVPSSVSTLSNLWVCNGDLPLAPSPFNSGTYTYSATVDYDTWPNGITVQPTLTDETNGSVYVNGEEVDSGSSSDSIPLHLGANTITIQVYAENSTFTTYTITITVKLPDLESFSAIACGQNHTLVIADGAVMAFGDNTFGQCDVPEACAVDVVGVSAGGNMSKAVKQDGTFVLWGQSS